MLQKCKQLIKTQIWIVRGRSLTKSLAHTKWITPIAPIGDRALKQVFCLWQQPALARTVRSITRGGLPAATLNSIPTLFLALGISKRGPFSILGFHQPRTPTTLPARKCTLLLIKMNTYRIPTCSGRIHKWESVQHNNKVNLYSGDRD